VWQGTNAENKEEGVMLDARVGVHGEGEKRQLCFKLCEKRVEIVLLQDFPKSRVCASNTPTAVMHSHSGAAVLRFVEVCSVYDDFKRASRRCYKDYLRVGYDGDKMLRAAKRMLDRRCGSGADGLCYMASLEESYGESGNVMRKHQNRGRERRTGMVRRYDGICKGTCNI
jgi:hypothetical protein